MISLKHVRANSALAGVSSQSASLLRGSQCTRAAILDGSKERDRMLVIRAGAVTRTPVLARNAGQALMIRMSFLALPNRDY
jgi:hypothetical protein